MAEELDYLFAAEDDYNSVKTLIDSGQMCNTIGYLTEQACEKYLKHLLCVNLGIGADESYIIPLPKEKLHKLTVLCATLKNKCDISTGYQFRQNLAQISYLYSSVRYPNSPDYHKITEEEIGICKVTLKDCRDFVMSHLKIKEIEEAGNEEEERVRGIEL